MEDEKEKYGEISRPLKSDIKEERMGNGSGVTVGSGERKQERRKRIRYQILILIVTFFGFALLHGARTSWSMMKNEIMEFGLETDELGAIDFSFLFAYACGLFFAGYIGDKFQLKRVISLGLILTSIFVTSVNIYIINQILTDWNWRNFWNYTASLLYCLFSHEWAKSIHCNLNL